MEKVVVNTNYNEKILKDFVRFHYKKLSLIIFICGCIISVCGIISLFITSIVSGITSICAGVVFIFYPKILEKTSLNANKQMIIAKDEYIFTKENVIIKSTIHGEERLKQDVKYSLIEKFASNDTYLYIYLNKSSAIIIERKNLSVEEQEFISKIINKELEARKIYNNKKEK